LLLGVGFAALRDSNDLWESSVFSITLGLLSISILLGVHRLGSRRAFWLGFALFGWIYLGFSLVQSVESRLITTRGLAYLDSKVPRSKYVSPPEYDNDGSMDLFVKNKFVNSLVGSSGTTEYFVRIGHSLLALIAAFLGGLLSRYLHARTLACVLGMPSPDSGGEPAQQLRRQIR
jgi:hypothetical protein